MSRNDQRIIDQLSRRALMAALMWAAFGYEEMTLPKRGHQRPATQEANDALVVAGHAPGGGVAVRLHSASPAHR
jgi:hypothetical protein